MTARIIDGKAVAASAIERVKAGAKAFTEAHGTPPGLAVVLVGEDPASQVYVASKGRMAKECGFHSVQHTLAADISQRAVLYLVATGDHRDEFDLPFIPSQCRTEPCARFVRLRHGKRGAAGSKTEGRLRRHGARLP